MELNDDEVGDDEEDETGLVGLDPRPLTADD